MPYNEYQEEPRPPRPIRPVEYEGQARRPAPPPPRRQGGCLSTLLAGLALVIALLALAVGLFRDPFKPVYEPRWNAWGTGLEGYDFSTASAAHKSTLRMRVNYDVRADIAYHSKLENKLVKEQFDTLDIKKEADVEIKEEIGTKKKVYDLKVLFISYRVEAEKKYEVVYYEKDTASGFWKPSSKYPSKQELEAANKSLAEEIEKWQEKNKEEK